MKILVTGGAGFIGSHLADGFIGEGHEVVVLDNLSMGRRENVNKKAGFYLMDIRADEVEKVFETEKFDAVCHQAAQMDVRRSVADPLFDADVNVKGTLNLLQNCIRYGVKKVLFASTGGAIYGDQDVHPCDETHPTRPVSPYGITKLCVEKYLYFFAKQYGLSYAIMRYSNVYGPRQNPHGEAGVVAIFTKKLLAGESPVINGDGKQTRDYVYVGDVVRANLSALGHETSDIFNVGTAIETDVNEIFTHLRDLSGSKAEEKHGPAKPGEQMRSVISYQKALKLMGWKPLTGLKEGLGETVNYFREQA
ncbi:NAD-dependent epimerase/dehydratase family protein [bacterium]|nr:NAD-dependent epimerase/dehydratase family protein [bacterium]